MTKNNTFKVYRATSSDLSNILLEPGEPLLVTDTNKLLFGDGLTFADNLQPINIGTVTSINNILPTNGDITLTANNISAADTNFSNVTSTAKATMANASMPSKTVTIKVGASGSTYTAPAAGYLTVAKTVTAAYQYLQLRSAKVRVNAIAGSSGQIPSCTLPCAKGDVVYIEYSAAGTASAATFAYAIGES